MSSVVVRENPTADRYEVYVADQLAGFVSYIGTGETLDLTHTEVDPAFSGRGLAKQLITEVLDDARRRGLAVLPTCPFVRRVVADNPAYLNLVPPAARDRFDLPVAGD